MKKVTKTPRRKIDHTKFNIIAIGASAGGLEALELFLSHLPELKDSCIIVAQHLSPTHKSMLANLLRRKTAISVEEASHNKKLEVNKIYITPPDQEITVVKEKLILQKPTDKIGPKPSVDVLFKSLVNNETIRSIGIILSGTGSDGAQGILALKENGGYIIVQKPETAKYDGMPQAAIQTGAVDEILPAEKMGIAIEKFLSDANRVKIQDNKELQKSSSLSRIMALLSRYTGTDFSDYKPPTIGRRLEKRMAMLHIATLEEYLDYMESHPAEVQELFNLLVIGVTTFFRDAEAFGVLEKQLEKLIHGKSIDDSIRIWIPGCSTGEEAYTLAIILDKLQKKLNKRLNLQIFATDIDERAIAFGRKGVYQITSLGALPQEILDSYFIKNGDSFELIKSIRSCVLFSKHDLISNPPFLKLDLISCRNLLIYFNAKLQQQVIPIFHYALLSEGYLFLGKSETIGNFGDLFSATDAKNKIYRRKNGPNPRSLRFSAYKTQPQHLPSARPSKNLAISITERVKETLFNTYENPYVVVNEVFDILEVNGDVRLYMSLSPGGIQMNLLKMVNRELQIEVRTLLTKAIRERASVKSQIKKFELFGVEYFVRLNAKPLIYAESQESLFVVIFEKMDIESFVSKEAGHTQEAFESVRIQELENELNEVREQLQTYIEELETSNEELQSLNEELQSTNEELQSSSEELETSNEELQSTNEEVQIAYNELKTIHEELEKKEKTLNTLQANTKALLNNELQAFVLVDNSYKVLEFNTKASEVFLNLKNKKIKRGDAFIDLIPSSQVERFITNFADVVGGKIFKGEEKFINAAGQEVWFSVNYSPVVYEENQVHGITLGFLEITALKMALSDLSKSERLVSSVFNSVATGVCITDKNGIFVDANDQYCQIYGYQKEEIIGQKFTMMVAPKHRKMMHELHDDFIMGKAEPPGEFEVVTKEGEVIFIVVTADLLVQPDGTRYKITSVRDITTEKKNESHLSLISKNLPAAIFRYKLYTYGDGEILYLSDGTEKLWGLQASDCLNNNQLVWDRMDGEDLVQFQSSLQQSAKTQNHWQAEWRFKHADGRVHWQRGTGAPSLMSDGSTVWNAIILDVTEEKLAQETLIKEREENQKILDRSLDVICSVDKEGNFVQMNASSEDIFGYKPEEMIGKPFLDFVVDEDIPATRLVLDQILAGKEFTNFENHYKHKEGKIVPIIWSAYWNESDKLMYCVAKDATEIRRTEAEMKLLIDNTEEAFILMDKELKVLYLNRQFEKLYHQYFGKKVEKGESILAYTRPEEQEELASIYMRVLQGEYEESVMTTPAIAGQERKIRIKYKPAINDKEKVVGAFVAAIDVTEQMQAEEQIKQSNERFEKVTQATNDAIWDWNIEADTLFWGGSFKTLFGYETGKFSPAMEVWQKNIHPEDLEGVKQSLEMLIQEATVTNNWQREYRYAKSDGSFAFVIDRGVVIRDQNGKAVRMVGAMADITERKSFEESLRELNIELEQQASDLEKSNTELEQFAYVASHDLQEPLRMVTSFLTLLEKKYSDQLDDKAHQYIEFAVRGAKRMRQIILDLLEYSRVGRVAKSPEKINLNELLDDVKLLLKNDIDATDAMITSDTLPTLVLDKTPMYQVFKNLIINGLKYRKTDTAPKLHISAIERAKDWEISVTDNGIGIHADYHDKIFVIFQRLHTQEEFAGSGMGLAVARKIIEGQGGKIWVKSQLGQGCTFHFTLPK